MAKSRSARKTAGRAAARRGAKKAARTRSVKSPKRARKAVRSKGRAARRAPAKGGAARKTVRKSAKTARKAAKPTARRTAARSAKSAKSAKKPARSAKKTTTRATPASRAAARKIPPRRPPSLDRERRTVTDTDRFPSPPSSLDMDRAASAARTGRAEMEERLHEHTSTSPAMTGGDIDADWESAETVGDEAPGGDNPTPDQDVVDEIGRALGIEYDDDEELQGGDEIVQRDKKRWELDPASSDDFDDRD
jgi:hypothetical protein